MRGPPLASPGHHLVNDTKHSRHEMFVQLSCFLKGSRLGHEMVRHRRDSFLSGTGVQLGAGEGGRAQP